MQYTLIAIQVNGQQVMLGRDMQEHSMNGVLREAVAASPRFERAESRYRSFLALGTTDRLTQVLRMNERGDIVSRTAGIV